MDYVINKRGLTTETINKFEIGLFPQNLRDLFAAADPKDLRAAGLIKNASVSMFKIHNLIMPIKDVYGNYLALAGRTLLTEEERKKINAPKYMNSVYKKSQHLFGLNFAKNKIIEKNIVYVVEGYFDVITPHQKGFDNVVATCGAFLSIRHVALLARYTNNIVVIMDNEPEAQEKARKSVEKNNYKGINLTYCNPLENEKEKDIDEYLRNHNLNDFTDHLDCKFDNIKSLW